jgi:hypothetical protein
MSITKWLNDTKPVGARLARERLRRGLPVQLKIFLKKACMSAHDFSSAALL